MPNKTKEPRKPSWLYHDRAWQIQLPPRQHSAKLLLCFLGSKANDDGRLWHGYRSIAAHTNITSHTTIREAREYLKQLGIVSWVDGVGDAPSRYTLNLTAMSDIVKAQGRFDLETGKLLRPADNSTKQTGKQESGVSAADIPNPNNSSPTGKQDSAGGAVSDGGKCQPLPGGGSATDIPSVSEWQGSATATVAEPSSTPTNPQLTPIVTPATDSKTYESLFGQVLNGSLCERTTANQQGTAANMIFQALESLIGKDAAVPYLDIVRGDYRDRSVASVQGRAVQLAQIYASNRPQVGTG